MHKKVLDKGKPDDVMPGIKNKKVTFTFLVLEVVITVSNCETNLYF